MLLEWQTQASSPGRQSLLNLPRSHPNVLMISPAPIASNSGSLKFRRTNRPPLDQVPPHTLELYRMACSMPYLLCDRPRSALAWTQINHKNITGARGGKQCLRIPTPSADPQMRQFPKPNPVQRRRRTMCMRIHLSRTLKLATVHSIRTLPSRPCQAHAPSTDPNSLLLGARVQHWTHFHICQVRVRHMKE
jgi:hypothetical protein